MHNTLISFGRLERALRASLFLLLIATAGCDKAPPETRHATAEPQAAAQTQLLNDNWLYLENNTKQVEAVPGIEGWQAIQLPHSWNATDTVDAQPGYRRNASWYQKKIRIEGGARQVLYFEGANMETEVYANGKLAGTNIGGYIGFEVELTDFLRKGQENTLLVRVSNAYNPNLIPSQKSDFFIQGGITRDVWLKSLPATFVQRVLINTPQVSHAQATTEVIISLDSKLPGRNNYQLKVALIAPDGTVVEEQEQSLTLTPGTQSVTVNFAPLANPQLWSVDTPNLYQVRAKLLDDQGRSLHQLTDRFGYRWFEMRPHQGFFVNGERLLIRGTHRHEDYAGLGAAIPNELHRLDMQMIKDMGANFVRLAHYPQDPEIYRAADELGLILWDELPWCRGGKGGAEWEQNTESLLRRQIEQNRNHPSIAFWSLGNEIYWEEDFPGGGAEEVINPYLEKLNTIAKELDPSRMTAIRKYYPGATIVDAFSPSIWAGWYGGAYGQYAQAIEAAMKEYPAFLHMEYGGASHVGRHSETPITATGLLDAQVSVEEAVNQAATKSIALASAEDLNENYMVDLFDWHLQVTENTPDFTGNAQWAFKDFATPLRPEKPIPYMNQKGLVDRSGKPKDVYYVFASYWSKKPFCYIESKTWTHRNGPAEGRDVTVYCNTRETELFLNGDSLGRKKRDPQKFPAGGLVWKTPFKNGVNQLLVKGYSEDVEVEDTLQVTYLIGKHGKLDKVRLSEKLLDGKRVLIEAEAIDKDGNRVLDFYERGYFSNVGESGLLLENYGTPSRSSTIGMANGYAAIEFERGEQPGTIEFRTQNVKPIFLEVSGK